MRKNNEIVEPKRYESTDELFSSLIELCKDNEFYLCRGETKSHKDCKPSIARNDEDENKLDEQTLAEVEGHLIAQFRQRAGSHMSENELIMSKTIWGTQMLMQHYGAPTRLLDWTYSPFVALYFACETNFKDDGYLEMYGVDGIRRFSKESTDTSGIPKRLKPNGLDPYFDADKLRDWQYLISGIKDGEKWETKDDRWLTFNQPSRTTSRVVAQQSVFTFGNPIDMDHAEWLRKHSDKEQIYLYEIDCRIKKEIILILNKMNINANALYPDLVGAGKAISRMYEARVGLIAPVDDWCRRLNVRMESEDHEFVKEIDEKT